MPMGPVGIIANPASGKDVRRLVARASVFDNREKSAIVRRALIGAIGAGCRPFVYLDDSHNIVGSAFDEVEEECDAAPLDVEITATARDTECAARQMQHRGCQAVLVLGGDGTSRAFARGWRGGPLIALSTGTNNVFPVFAEATVAGAAAGLIAGGHVAAKDVSQPCKILDVEIEDEPDEIALIDVVVSSERFVGARALLDATALQFAFLTRAETNAVGISALGGLLQPVSEKEDVGLYVVLGGGPMTKKIYAPIAPGLYEAVSVSQVRRFEFGERLEIEGPCMLAFDGERERMLASGQRAWVSVSRTGPAVIDIARTLALGAAGDAFTISGAKHAD